MPTYKTEDFEVEDDKLKLKDSANTDDKIEGGDLSTEDDKSKGGNETVVDDTTADASEAEKKPASTKKKFEELEFDDEELPEQFRGKVKTGKDLIERFTSLAKFANDLYNERNAAKTEGDKKKEEVKEEPLLSEDDLGIGANAVEVEKKLRKLVEDRTAPFAMQEFQRLGERNMENLFKDEKKYPHANRFKDEIASAAAQLELEAAAKPAVWDAIYHQIVGRNASKLIEELSKKDPPPKPKPGTAEKGDNGTSGKNRSNGNDADDFEAKVKAAKLSPEEERVIEDTGINRDAYIRRALKMGYELNGKL